MQITLHTDYALRLLIYLVERPGQNVSTREIAEHYGISVEHLIKVAKSLTQGRWVIASRGVGGGLKLADHTLEARIGDIVRFTENTDLAECFDRRTNTCPIHRCCHLKPILYQARQAFFEVLDSHRVKELGRRPGELFQRSLG